MYSYAPPFTMLFLLFKEGAKKQPRRIANFAWDIGTKKLYQQTYIFTFILTIFKITFETYNTTEIQNTRETCSNKLPKTKMKRGQKLVLYNTK